MRWTSPTRARCVQGFTLVELLVTLAIIGLLAALLAAALPAAMKKTRTHKCSTNLRSFGVALIGFADDHDGKLRLGALNSPNSKLAGLSNCLSTPKILLCPTDNRLIVPWVNGGPDVLRGAATQFPGLQNSNVSYFYSGPREFGSRAVLAGDRNLCQSAYPDPTTPITTSIQTITTNQCFYGWNRFLHEFRGNLAMGDGSVQLTTSDAVQQAIKQQALWPGNKVTFNTPNDWQ